MLVLSPLGAAPAAAAAPVAPEAGSLASAASVAAAANPPFAAWSSIGPSPEGSPAGTGRVTALAVRDANTVYLGGAEGGVWKTTNGGTTWTALSDTMPSLSIG